MAADDSRPLDELDEPALVQACLAQRAGAFDLIVERHRRAVYQLCYRFVGSHEDASDLSQDVFLRAYRGLRSFRGHSTLATWLYRIGVNVCLNRVSAKTTLGKLTEPIDEKQFVDVRAESPSDLMMRDERAARVRAAIAQLPRKQRATLILRTYHEMSHQEIADVLGSSVGAVKANFFHALGNLKKILGGETIQAMHLNAEELVDIAEGTRSEATAPHLAGCEPCRAQLRGMRAMMATTRDVDVPEPSPLFWDHLSARIGEAVAEDAAKPRRSSRWFPASVGVWQGTAIAAVAGVVLLGLTVSLRAPAPAPPPASLFFAAPPPPLAATADAGGRIDLLGDVTADDAPLTLVASLTDGLDFDGAREAGLAPRGSAEHAIIHMSDGELRELRRLLKEELQ